MTDSPEGSQNTSPLPKQAILIVNAMSRSGAEVFDEVRDKLVASGIDVIEAHAIANPDEMEPAVRNAIAKPQWSLSAEATVPFRLT